MAKIVRVRAPEKTSLARMSEAEISKLAASEAGKYLSALPAGVRPVGVNAVSLSSHPNEDVGAWAEWTRSCDDQRNKIDDFTDPGPDEIAQLTAESLKGEKFQSSLTIRQVSSKVER